MGTITNVIKTLFTTSGADSTVASANKVSKGLDNVNKSTDTFTRASTRQGQASAGASRQFAAQASGLGGLVAAYAGAAATLFAVQAAYEALAQAAKAETVIKGTSALAAATAQSGPAIIKTIKDITDGQLTMAEAAQNASTALAAGFNTQQIEDLSRVAQKASMALGRDFTDSLQRITRGVAKLEPELLDELGIFTRIEPAVQKYARELGISAKTLNEFQRRQAFANAAIEEGDRKFSMIDTSAQSLQKTLEQLRVNVSELFTSVMQIIGSALSPFVDFLNNNVGAGILAFGFLLSKIFSKATQEVGMFADRTGAKLSSWAGNLADKASFAEGTIESLRAAIMKPINAEKGAGLAQIRTAPRAKQDKAQATRFETALNIQRESADLSPSALNDINIAYKEQLTVLEQLDPKNAKNTQSFKNLTAAVQRNETAIVSAGGRIKGFIGLSNTLKGVAAALTVGFRGLAIAVERLFFFITTIQLVGSLFDIDLLGAVVGMFKDISNASKEMADGFKGIAVAAAGGGVALTAELKRLGATEDQIAGFGDRLARIRTDTAENAKLIAAEFVNIPDSSYSLPIYNDVKTPDLIAAVTKQLEKQQAIVTGGTGLFTYASDIEEAKLEIVALNYVLKTLEQGSQNASRVIAQIATTSGLSGEQLAKVFTPEIQNSTDALSILGLTIEKVNDSYSLENLTTEQRKLIDVTGLSRNTAIEFAAAVKAGAVTVTSTGATLAGLEGNLLITKAAYNSIQGSVANLTAEEIKHRTSLGLEIAAQQKVVDSVRAVEAALIDIETRYAALTSVFSADIKIMDTAEAQGVVDAFGKIALSQEQIAINQATYLATQIKSSAYSASLVGDEKAIEDYVKKQTAHIVDRDAALIQQQVLSASIAKDAELYDAALKAAEGRLVNITVNLGAMAEKLGTNVAQALLDVATQLKAIEAEKTTAKIQFEIDSLNLDMEAAKAAREFNIAFLENQIKLTELSVEEKQTKPVAGAEQINTYESDILVQRRALIEDERRIAEDIYKKESIAATDAFNLEKDRIDLETAAKINAITSEYNLLRDAVITYHSIASTLETAIVTGGNTMGQTIVSALNAGVKAFADSLGPLGNLLNIKPQVAAFTAAPLPGSAVVGYTAGQVVTETEVQIGKDLAPIFSGVHDATTAIATLGEAQIDAASQTTANELALSHKKYAAEKLAFDRRVALLMQETGLSEGAARKRLEEAKAAEAAGGGAANAAEAVELLTGRLADLQSTIKGGLESAFMSINDLIIQGAQDGKDAGEVLRDVISGLFNTIQQEVFKQTIATPLADMISNWVVGGIKQLNLTDIRGSSLSGVLGSARGATGEDLTNNVMSDKAILAGGEAFKKAGATINSGIASLGTGVNAAAGVGANAVSSAAGILATTTTTSTGAVAAANVAGAGTLMSSLGPILAVLAVIAVIVGLFGGKKSKLKAELAATPSTVTSTSSSIALDATRAMPANLNLSPTSINSMPKMAIGGLRDRVPTMLEPGEFVIRKPMVSKIGTSALESMNATGAMPNSAPVINIKNEGSPKDATASPPRFDGEKYVIDIVMRDLANNGPIRKSLRGGAL